jgi:hypothetical protein
MLLCYTLSVDEKIVMEVATATVGSTPTSSATNLINNEVNQNAL